MPPTRTLAGKLVLYRTDTGERREFWPVDARGMIASGEFTDTPPAGVEPEPVAVLPSAVAPMLPRALPPHPLGIPTVATHSRDAAPGVPYAGPVRSKGPKAARSA